MADIGNVAVEKLQGGKLREYKLYEGSATAQEPGEFDWGTGDEGAYTYATMLRSDDLVIFDTTADFRVTRAGSGAQGKTLVGVLVGAPQGKAGEEREGRVYHFGDWDILRLECASAIAVGDKVSVSGAYNKAYPHGFRVATDATNGIGWAMNSTSAAGQKIALMLKPGTY